MKLDLTMDEEIAIAGMFNTPIGDVYITPGGVAMATWRIGGPNSTPDLSDDEIALAGLAGKVQAASAKANRLHGLPTN